MFTRVAAFALAALPLLAVATPLAARDDCSTGPIQCCQSTEWSSSPAGSALLGLLGVVVQGVDVLIGLQCSPITAIGVGSGNTCNAQAVCCQNNNVGGLISVGCVPVSL
ncbi:fungal hydrophobin [Epithele typhae]|uniref:fungal hydrophobin n=1 Tax=Epithele typhae TaxID=378194 RepID=UPI002007C687|nr:fungal hydrophobin [Epithele typhae]KAH9919986.1 fungal hydrophobin [Epithele typhae]